MQSFEDIELSLDVFRKHEVPVDRERIQERLNNDEQYRCSLVEFINKVNNWYGYFKL